MITGQTTAPAATPPAPSGAPAATPEAVLANAGAAPQATATDPAAQAAPDPASAPKEPEAPKESTIAAIVKAKKQQLALKKELERERAERTKLATDFDKLKPTAEKLSSVKNPIEALQAAGFTYEDAVNFMMNDGKLTADQQIKSVEEKLAAKIKEMEDKDAAKETARLEAEANASKAREDQAMANLKTSVKEMIAAEPDTYELTSLYDPDGELVIATMEQDWANKVEAYNKSPGGPLPKVLSNKEAADMAEKFWETEVEKSLKTKKLSAKLKPADPAVKQDETPQAGAGGTAPKTLTNSMTGSASAAASAKSDAERWQRALAALEGKR